MRIKHFILLTFLLTSCSETSVSSSSFLNSSFISSSINSTINSSTSSSAIDQAQLKVEIDELFNKTIIEQRNKNGNLSMYDVLQKQYAIALTNTRRKALYYMSLNPKLDEYLNNPIIQVRMDIIIKDNLKVFIPENPELGFMIPYLITLPQERYKGVNEGHKQYLFFEASNHIDINTPWGNFNRMLETRVYNNGYAMDFVPNELYWPKVLSIMPQPSIQDTTKNEFNMARLLNRISVLATKSDYQNYIVYPQDGFNNTVINNYDQVFNEYIFNQHLDVELQSRNIILHSQKVLRDIGFPVEDKIFMGGFSGSGVFTNRFATIYPEMLKGIAHGGNLYPILPGDQYQGYELLFPLGIADNKEIFGRSFDLEKYNHVAKLEFFGKQEVWTHYPHDYLDNLDKLSTNLFGNSGYSRLLNNHKAYFELGGQKVTIITTDVGHFLHANDAAYMKEFFILNRDSDKPVYPPNSKYSNHIYVSHLNLSNLEREIIANPATFLPFYTGTLLLFTSLVGKGGGPHEDAAWKRFQDQIYLAPYIDQPDLLAKHNVYLVVYDTTMRSKLKLTDLKVNITVNPGEVVSVVNTDNKRVIVLYPKDDDDGIAMIESLPADITTKDQRYYFNN